MAQLQLWKKRGLGKHCADALILIPELMWSKAPKYALCRVSMLTKAGQVAALAPTYCWIKVPQSNISTHFPPHKRFYPNVILK